MRDYTLHGLLTRLEQLEAFDRLRMRLDRGDAPSIGPLGLPGSVQPAVVAALIADHRFPVLWMTPEPDEARALADALQAYLPAHRTVHRFPAPDALPFERVAWDPATRELRMAALAAIHNWRALAHRPDPPPPPVVVAPIRGVLTCTLPPDIIDHDTMVIQAGDQRGLSALMEQLHRLGYEVVGRVEEPGQMARRGGIVDLFPPSLQDPVRIEWFGDEIESLRSFDPVTQRSHAILDRVAALPAREALATRGPEVAGAMAQMETDNLHPLADTEWRRHTERLQQRERFEGIEFFLPLLHPERATLLGHVPAGTLLIVDDAQRLQASAESIHEQGETVRREQVDAGELPTGWTGRPLRRWATLSEQMEAHPRLLIGRGDIPDPGATPASESSESWAAFRHRFATPQRFGGKVDDAVLDIMRLSEQGEAVVVVSRQAPRIAELLTDVGRPTGSSPNLDVPPGAGGIAVVHGALGAGWTLSGDDTVPTTVITDGEIFGWRMPHRRRRARERDEAQVDYFSELTPGDHIVHIEHGIGLFQGLKRMAIGDADREYLVLEYAAGDVLYVPTHQADRVSRYVGTGDVSPSVTRLGTADWERAKSKARKEVEDIAEELLELYARRHTVRRAAFSSDTAWQAEMEAAFPYVETDDQLRAIEAVKSDMESERPMDRLVVGDVGFGKTEVALRAAFKAVMDGRQVAVLAPTTVLAQQHYETFQSRMSAFPVKAAVLSRFRKRSEQRETLQRLADGDVDIVIGTHRLLSEDVVFSDLGLLIVDEEHRFGVKHKERLRQMAEGVDTLTLTATPIPRTMHLALTGLRDLTKIDTPPSERLPVVTHVGTYDDHLVRQAMRREMGRKGQVFYVSDRVQGMGMLAQKIQKLVPESRVTIAHGQMRESELARAMLEFVGGMVDVLVCTSIIESGLDIPNANTLIVERSHRFGLAQLHQLRGRVGRSAQRAYAYFLTPQGYELPPDARDRLQALAEYADLGAGFRLAMRDLEIRGAGEILGARQHGQVAAIGLDLYTKLLAEAIKNVRADRDETPDVPDQISRELEEIDPGTLPTVDLPIDAFIPDDYIEETAERTRMYRRMARADRRDDVEEIERELRDRFGAPPQEVENLLRVLRMRVMAHIAAASSVGLEGDAVAVRWPEDHPLDREAIKAAVPPTTRVGRHRIALPIQGPPDRWLPSVVELLEAIAGIPTPRLAVATPGSG